MRTLALVLTVAAALLVPGPGAQAREPRGLEVTGWILQSGSNRLVERNADGLSTLSVAGVSINPAATASPGRPTTRCAWPASRAGTAWTPSCC